MKEVIQTKIKEHTLYDQADLLSNGKKLNLIQKPILNCQDNYENTMLHIL